MDTNSSNNNNNNNGFPHQDPKSNMEALKDTYPTVYVKADTSTFKQVVQRLTGPLETKNYGSSESTPSSPRNKIPLPPIRTTAQKQQLKLNLHARRKSHSNLNPLLPLFPSSPSGFAPSPRYRDINLSPSSNFNFTALCLSPATPHMVDQYQNRIPNPNLNTEAGNNAINGLFLHPSPANTSTPRVAEPPRLLQLFPTSPQAKEDPSST